MGKIIVVANQKGGVGKTTTTVNVAASLAKLGKRVLLVDMDPQGNATSGLGVEKDALENTVYRMLLGECDIRDAILSDILPDLSVLPSNIQLAAAEIELVEVPEKEFLLKKALQSISDEYDYVLIDCPPSLNLLTINAMCTGDSLLIPIQSEYYALEGLTQLLYTQSLVSDRMNSELEIEGIVFTMYDARTNLSQQVVENVKENLQDNIHVFETIIPRNVRLAEAPSFGLPIVEYDPKSAGAQSYLKLAEEIVRKR